MKKLYSYNLGVHYKYRGWTIYKDKETPGETKYSYIKGEWTPDNRFGHARTLELCKLWIDIEEDDAKQTTTRTIKIRVNQITTQPTQVIVTSL